MEMLEQAQALILIYDLNSIGMKQAYLSPISINLSGRPAPNTEYQK
jgi:hypothetical protein